MNEYSYNSFKMAADKQFYKRDSRYARITNNFPILSLMGKFILKYNWQGRNGIAPPWE